MKLSQIKKNPNNPRLIKDAKFELLKKSIQDFPQMMELRPIVIDESNVILGGNMRYEAIKALKMAEFPDSWVKRVEELTEEQKKEFIVKDNVGFGEWSWDELANEWDSELLSDWGLDVPVFDSLEDYSDKNQELNLESFEDKQVIKLEYSMNEAEQVRKALFHIAPTLEQAVWSLLKLDES